MNTRSNGLFCLGLLLIVPATPAQTDAQNQPIAAQAPTFRHPPAPAPAPVAHRRGSLL